MPSRILREGILASPRMARLGGWAEEVFYRRLMSVVDDFGRYYADHGLLRAACYPRQLNKVSDSDIGKWLTACVNAALVRVYPAQDGESYLQVLDFGQQVRAKKSKFPDALSTCVADAKQVQEDAHLDVSVSVSVVDKPPHPPAGGADGFSRFWQAWPDHKRRVGRKQCAAKWATQGCEPIADRIVAHVEAMKATEDWKKSGGEFIPAPLVYLNQNRWEASPPDAPSNTVAPAETAEQYVERMAQERRDAERDRATPEQRAATSELLRLARQHITAKGLAA